MSGSNSIGIASLPSLGINLITFPSLANVYLVSWSWANWTLSTILFPALRTIWFVSTSFSKWYLIPTEDCVSLWLTVRPYSLLVASQDWVRVAVSSLGRSNEDLELSDPAKVTVLSAIEIL